MEGEAFAEVMVDVPHRRLDHTFSYRIPLRLEGAVLPGIRVLVPLGRRQVEGVVAGLSEEPGASILKDVLEVLDVEPALGPEGLELAAWMARRFLSPMYAAVRLLLPPGGSLAKKAGKPRTNTPEKGLSIPESSPALSLFHPAPRVQLNREQESALGEIMKGLERRGGTFLLHGITGSGKTEIYLRAVEENLARGRQALLLVPEISLTPQLLERLQGRIGSGLEVLHSGLRAKERRQAWWRIKRGEAKVAVGARSAIFAPFQNLGLIVLDEEHIASYQEETSPCYQTVEVARWRASRQGAVLILGSATPSLESYARARQGLYRLLTLTGRAGGQQLPRVEIVDMREEQRRGNAGLFSRRLRAALAERLERGEQAILLLNRRGFYGVVVCRDCGSSLSCPRCDITMTYHRAGERMICHYCGHARELPKVCPDCGSGLLRGFGVGTQQVEAEMQRFFPQARVLRVDADTTSGRDAHAMWYEAMREERVDVLVGTQMVSKGLDLPQVTLVGVVAADTSLRQPDFRARERTFQLLTQVAGRAGRGRLRGEAILQTFYPEDPAVRLSALQDFNSFFLGEMAERRRFGYPPYSHVLRLLLAGSAESTALKGAQELAARLKEAAGSLEVLGPAYLGRRKDRCLYQITVKCPELNVLLEAAGGGLEEWSRGSGSSLSVRAEIDPQGLA